MHLGEFVPMKENEVGSSGADDSRIVRVERHAGIATITLNRPTTRNAFNTALRKQFLEEMREIESFHDLRVVILTGAGASFCAGADLKAEMANDVRMALLAEYVPMLRALRGTDLVILAAVHGASAGFGAAILAAADLAIMAEDATIQLAFSRIALVPDGGLTWELVRALGYKRAYRLMIEGGRLDAKQCLSFGLINEVVPASRLKEEALAWAEQLCRLSPTCNGLTKRALHYAQNSSLEEAMTYEADLQQVASRSEDCREGVAAFRNKRSPDFRGRTQKSTADFSD